jgi:trehalose 6-phosphate synthase
MPLIERRMRWEAMMDKLREGSIQRWFSDFLDELQGAHAANEAPITLVPPAIEPAAAAWPLRSVSARDGVRFY